VFRKAEHMLTLPFASFFQLRTHLKAQAYGERSFEAGRKRTRPRLNALAAVWVFVGALTPLLAVAQSLLVDFEPPQTFFSSHVQWNQAARSELKQINADLVLNLPSAEESQTLALVETALVALRQNLYRPRETRETSEKYRSTLLRILWAASKLHIDDSRIHRTLQHTLHQGIVIVTHCLQSALEGGVPHDANPTLMAHALGFLSELGGSNAVLGITLVLGQTATTAPVLHQLATDAMILAATRRQTLSDCTAILFPIPFDHFNGMR